MKLPPPLPPQTPVPRRPSAPELNAKLAEHERDRRSQHDIDLAKALDQHKAETSASFTGAGRQMDALATEIAQNSAVTIAVARAVGVDPGRIPANLAKRSMAPPAAGTPPGEQAPTLPKVSKGLQISQVLAFGVVVFESLREGLAIIHSLIH